ncbi:MAG: diphosphomevalonate decarboxylase [Candidatus Peribacteraceae bacterium]
MNTTAVSFPNIAFIKYWGNRNNALRLPAADSLSMTLDRPSVEITLSDADRLSIRSFEADGKEKILTEKQISRWKETLDLMRSSLGTIGAEGTLPETLSLEIRSHIPPSVGLASSAAVFSCLARAVQGFISDKTRLTEEQTSVLARLGSGSAARSIFDGYAALLAGSGNDIDAAVGKQIADESHWTLYDFVIIPSTHEKKVGSTEGHALAHTSPLFDQRVKDITERRQPQCIDAVLRKDFELLQQVVEEDALDMHAVMESSTPPLKYLSEETHRILREITSLREERHLPVLYTMDAGPTVHLIFEESALGEMKQFTDIQKQKRCLIFEAKVGKGAYLK